MSQLKDTEYLRISSRVRAMENRLMTRERLERMIDARDNAEALKVLAECGYGELSGSAALGVGAELIETYGPDSLVGRTAAVMLGSTETTFYTVAVYFGAAKVAKTRYAVPAALCGDIAGFLAASWAVRLLFN